MRIREDGKHSHRTETIKKAAEFWDCNKTKALLQSAEFAWRLDRRINEVLEREDLTVQQKREIADTISVPGVYELSVSDAEISINRK